jgi:hypothetical protein
MSRITISVSNHDQPHTVSEMRKRLAQILSRLNGSQEVTFSFSAVLPDYVPGPQPSPKHRYTPAGCAACDLTDTPHMPYCEADERFLD